jgi:hypothetical protein
LATRLSACSPVTNACDALLSRSCRDTSQRSATPRVMIDFLVDAFGGAPPWDRDDGNWTGVTPGTS